MLALEQARSIFTGWIRSCVSCLSPWEDKADGHQQNHEPADVERDMQVCHNQPHLIPPMRLRVYDDLPSPNGHQPRHSVSSWIAEGRNLASRASHRASMLNPRRKSSAQLRISGPSDFRTVQSFQQPSSTPAHFQPLELSIYQSSNRLSDLPSFESFQLEEERRQRQTLAAPPRALSPIEARSRRCLSTHAAFHVPRKPVGSGERRRSLSDSPEQQLVRPVRITSALIPHFSVVTPVELFAPQEELHSRMHERSVSYDSRATLINRWPSRASDAPGLWFTEPPTLAVSKNHQEPPTQQSPSISSSRTVPARMSSLPRPSFTLLANQKTSASGPSLSTRMTQWFFPSANKPSTTTPSPVSTDKTSLPRDRLRTLSGSTVASTATITGGGKTRPTNSSISSTLTSATTVHTSIRGPSPTTEKELEAGVSPAPRSHSPANHPTIYEDPQQQQKPYYASSHADDPVRHRESAVAMAF